MKSEVCLSIYSVDIKKLLTYSDFETLSNTLIELKEKVNNEFRKLSFSIDFICGHDNSVLGAVYNYSPDTAALMSLFYNQTIGSNISSYTTDQMVQNISNNSFEKGSIYYTAYCLEDYIFWPNIEKQCHSITEIYNFDCEILSKYPLTNDSFIRRANYIFSDVYFSENCFESIRSIKGKDITYFSAPFVRALSALQQCAPLIKNSNNNSNDLVIIGATAGFECTAQGSNKDNRFNFMFKIDSQNEGKNIFCEYHLKINTCNNRGDSFHYQNRIYFGLSNIKTKGKVICIGHIGGHL